MVAINTSPKPPPSRAYLTYAASFSFIQGWARTLAPSLKPLKQQIIALE
jgi:hypothetical protein